MSLWDELGNIRQKLSPTGMAETLGASDGLVEDMNQIDPTYQTHMALGTPGFGERKRSKPAPPGKRPFTGAANQPAVPVQDPNRQMYQAPQLPLHEEGFMQPVQPVQMRNSQLDEISKLLRGG